LAIHLRLLRNGTVEPLTMARKHLIVVCHLNRPLLIDFRNYVLDLMNLLCQRQSSEGERILRKLLCFPADLPNLKAKRPPAGNTHPNGLAISAFEQRNRGELPEVY
jgi:hypothetical protein